MEKNIINIRSTFFSLIITLGLIFFLFTQVSFSELFVIILTANVHFLFLAVLSYLGFNLILSYRYYVLANAQYSPVFWNVLKFHFTSMLLSDITPGRIGYFGMVEYMKSEVRRADSTVFLVIALILDFFLKLVAICTFILIFGLNAVENSQSLLLAVIFVVLVVSFLSFLLWGNFIVSTLDQITDNESVVKLVSMLKKIQNVPSLTKLHLTRIFVISVLGWFFIGLQWYFTALALNINDFSYLYYILIQGAASSLSFLPIALGGIGPQEAGIIAFLTLNGLVYSKAIAFSVLVKSMSIIIDFLGGIKNILGKNS